MKLQLGYNHSFEIRKETLAATVFAPFSVLYLSDLHFNAHSKSCCHSIIQTINALNPDIILLGGDYVDTEKGLLYFNVLMEFLAKRNHVFAIAGNHDPWFGLSKIVQIVARNNIHWIEQSSIIITLGENKIAIDGGKPTSENREGVFSILCLHKPLDIATFASAYQLAFAGHLHGCQAVLWQRGHALFPGRWFYKWSRLLARAKGCSYYISKGLGDTLPLRYNCPKDVIFIDVGKIVPYKF